MEYDTPVFRHILMTLKYAAPGSQKWLQEVAALIKNAGFAVEFDDKKRLDHGGVHAVEVMYRQSGMSFGTRCRSI